MGIRCSPLATGVLVVAAVVLMSSGGRAHWYELGPSKDEWGLKYEGKVDATNGDKLTVQFTLGDQGRLKPIHSVFVMALGNPERGGSRTYVLKTRMSLQPTTDGTHTWQVEIGKEFANRAMIRVFTYSVDGRSQMAGPMAGARYYDIPLTRFLKKAPLAAAPRAASSVAAPPAARVGE